MTTTAIAAPDTLWFFDSLAQIRVSHEEGDGRLSVVEMTAPRGSMPPLHVHAEDETFFVLEGAMTLYAGDRVERLSAGDSILAPRNVPHTFVVESDVARTLVVTEGDFERYVRAIGRPAESATLPPPLEGPPSPDELAAVARIAAEYGIELIGPPGMLPTDLA
jgi:quercetin dioxygenase-like cupin family protein